MRRKMFEELMSHLEEALAAKAPELEKVRRAADESIRPREGYSGYAAIEMGRCAGMLANTGGISHTELKPLLQDFPTWQLIASIPNDEARGDVFAKFRSLCCLMMIGQQLEDAAKIIMTTAVESERGLAKGLKAHAHEIKKTGSMDVEMIISDGYSSMVRNIMTGLANYFTAHMGIKLSVSSPAATTPPPEATKQEPVPETCPSCGKQH